MNQRTTYEKLIANKLQELPVPDMASAIWLRIEQQLDVEMPVNDPGSSNGNAAFPGQLSMGILAVVLVAILMGIHFLLRETRSYEHPERETPVHTVPAATPKEDPLPIQKTPDTTIDIQQPPADEEMITQDEEPAIVSMPESVIKPEATPVQEMDAMVVLPKVKPTLIVPPDSSNKKSRGVKGISLDDYRIAPVKKGHN